MLPGECRRALALLLLGNRHAIDVTLAVLARRVLLRFIIHVAFHRLEASADIWCVRGLKTPHPFFPELSCALKWHTSRAGVNFAPAGTHLHEGYYGNTPPRLSLAYSPRRGADSLSVRPSAGTLDTPVVPEPGTAATSRLDAAILAGRKHLGAASVETAPRGLATRKPILLFEFVGLLLLRLEDCRFVALLFQLPPRIPRFLACRSTRVLFTARAPRAASPSFARAPRGPPRTAPIA